MRGSARGMSARSSTRCEAAAVLRAVACVRAYNGRAQRRGEQQAGGDGSQARAHAQPGASQRTQARRRPRRGSQESAQHRQQAGRGRSSPGSKTSQRASQAS